MSIPVPVGELESAMAGRPVSYLTTTDGTRVKVVQVFPRVVGAMVVVEVGPGTLRNLTDHPDIVLVSPPVGPKDSYTLLVDGMVDRIDDDSVVIRPVSAVLHRRSPA